MDKSPSFVIGNLRTHFWPIATANTWLLGSSIRRANGILSATPIKFQCLGYLALPLTAKVGNTCTSSNFCQWKPCSLRVKPLAIISIGWDIHHIRKKRSFVLTKQSDLFIIMVRYIMLCLHTLSLRNLVKSLDFLCMSSNQRCWYVFSAASYGLALWIPLCLSVFEELLNLFLLDSWL